MYPISPFWQAWKPCAPGTAKLIMTSQQSRPKNIKSNSEFISVINKLCWKLYLFCVRVCKINMKVDSLEWQICIIALSYFTCLKYCKLHKCMREKVGIFSNSFFTFMKSNGRDIMKSNGWDMLIFNGNII